VGVLTDEPTVGQDRRTWSVVVGLLAAGRDAGAGVALASHDPDALSALGDDELTLEHGVVLEPPSTGTGSKR
jgi:ABC-type Mn2+/Zn2+ transport system ATPase subunit